MKLTYSLLAVVNTAGFGSSSYYSLDINYKIWSIGGLRSGRSSDNISLSSKISLLESYDHIRPTYIYIYSMIPLRSVSPENRTRC